jgi:putative hydrolase
MSMEEMRAQRAEITALNTKYGAAFHVFQGVEANILIDGRLDMQPDELKELDLVVASPHSSLRKTFDQTERMLAAVAMPGVHILGHPRGRIFNTRLGIIADWPAVFRLAAKNGVAIELDGDVSRQDLDHRIARAAKKAGCLFALDSDAHAGDQLWMADYALAHARLAGIPADRIVNCWPPDKILEWASRAWQR